jgi:RimJ/RimL family protein N-acetyltransferase
MPSPLFFAYYFVSKLPIKSKVLTLRPRRDRDEAFLRLAFESSREEELKDVIWPNEEARHVFFDHQFNAQELHFKNFYDSLDYDIIEYKGKPIGRLVLSWKPDHLDCVDIIIITKHRRQQIGTTIMKAIVKEVDIRKISASLMFEKWKPYLEAFYNKFGFIKTTEVPTHWRMERERQLKTAS